MQPFLCYITNSLGQSATVVNGSVEWVGSPTPVDGVLTGRNGITVAWERNLDKHGLQRNFTLPIEMTGPAGLIIRDTKSKKSIEEKVFLVVKKFTVVLTGATYRFKYSHFYIGELDMSEAKGDRTKMVVPVMEGGVIKHLKANENTVYQIPFDDDHINIKMDGMELEEKHNWIVQSGVYAGDDLIGMLFINKEGNAPGFASFTVYKQNEPGDLTTSDQYFSAVSQAITNKLLMGELRCTSLVGGTTSAAVRLKSSLGQNILVGTFTQPGSMTVNQVYSSAAEEKWFLVLDNTGGLVTAALAETNLSVKLVSRYKTTYVKAQFPRTVGKLLVNRLSGGESNFESILLEENKNLVITSGNALRGFDNATIPTNFSDFYSSYNAILKAGMGEEAGALRIETRNRYYNSSSPIHLGKAKTHITYPAKEFIYNTIKTGGENQSYEDVNGRNETNTTHLYSTPITRLTREYNAVSKYRIDPYGMEHTRINFDRRNSTDSDNDNDIFIANIDLSSGVQAMEAIAIFSASTNSIALPYGIDLAPGQRLRITGSALNDKIFKVLGVGNIVVAQVVTVDQAVVDEAAVTVQIEILTGVVYELKRVVYDSITGIPFPASHFNIEQLTGKRILVRHLDWIISGLCKLDGKLIKFEKADKNQELRTQLGADVFDEDANVMIGGARIFQDTIHEIETEVPINLVQEYENNPHLCFSFEDEWGNIFTGFPLLSALAAETREQQNFKLLAAPADDLTLLI